MDIRIESLHFSATNELQAFITEKIEKLQNFYERIENCNVLLKLDPSNINKNKVVELIFNVPGLKLFAKEQDETFEAAAASAIDYMKKQIIKHKEKLSAHKPSVDEAIEPKKDDF